MVITWELLLGPLGAVVVLWLWKEDLRKQRDDAIARLNRIIDKVEASLDRADPR